MRVILRLAITRYFDRDGAVVGTLNSQELHFPLLLTISCSRNAYVFKHVASHTCIQIYYFWVSIIYCSILSDFLFCILSLLAISLSVSRGIGNAGSGTDLEVRLYCGFHAYPYTSFISN